MPLKLIMMFLMLLLATASFIFFVWLEEPARVAEPCPEECHCLTGGIQITCSAPSLTTIPLIHFPNVLLLDLSYSKITLLEKDSFFQED